MVRRLGLRRLAPARVDDRLAAAYELGCLTEEQTTRYAAPTRLGQRRTPSS